MARFKFSHPKPGETEYGGRMGGGTAGVPEDRPESALSASDEMRLSRTTDPNDRKRRFNLRVWRGETPVRTPAQVEGDLRS
jgi:hypothetical protein